MTHTLTASNTPRSAASGAHALILALALAGCGARSALTAPEIDAGAGDASADASASERPCVPNCTVGHTCCVGGCDGPTVPLPSDCCACLPGEVNSMMCPDGACGDE